MYDYARYSRRRTSVSPLLIVAPVLLIFLLGVYQTRLRALPAVESSVSLPASTPMGTPVQLPLPSNGAAVVAVAGLGTLGTSGAVTPRPIASVAKMMTAWVVLKDKPLRQGEQGPTVTLTNADVARYQQAIQQDQSAEPVLAGEQISEYQLLQGMLIPSANNFAEILGAWDAGTLTAFVAKMNAEAKALGMSATTYVDASGFESGSVSTPADQLLLEQSLMQSPVFAEIVAMPTAKLPGIVAPVSNVNELLGQNGIIGIKTGFTDDAGYNLAFAANTGVGGQTVQVIGGVYGQATRELAFDATKKAIVAVGQALQSVRAVSNGQIVGAVHPAWTGAIDVVAGEDASLLLWPGMSLQATVQIDALQAPLAAGTRVGTLHLALGQQQHDVPLLLAKPLSQPGTLWKLTRT